MKHIKLLAAAFCISAAINTAHAQLINERDYKVITPKSYMNVEGTPYLTDEWQPGDVKLVNGVTSQEKLMLKYNLVDDMLLFKEKGSDNAMSFVVPVQEFTISPAGDDKVLVKHFRAGYKDIEGNTPTSFYQVLSDGKVQLLRKDTKKALETQEIGSASKTTTFIEKTKYYLVVNGKTTQVKNDKKSLLAVLADKQAQLEDYIKTNKVNFKDDAQLGKLVDYYNTL
ncbi:hypothetical protein [Mucilaginibacter pedocola]|uniref:DUF4369 domain-containing protein n=1 Tax=Mucilaginibacter pedocola TaxID=1792845 RepID=A0A1S9PIL6_9SPHI|nr:hypothetical protein [Mucilaginibacter pedocola]OOQ60796.1 hypothetical protein BC343_22745 [Mucilaginibacter pedocola]